MAPKITGLGIFSQSSLSVVGGMSVAVFSGSSVGMDSGQLTQIARFDIDSGSVVSSSPSITTYHSTLFEDFNLTATPVYNFYVQDEQTNPQLPLSASLRSLPRYVSLSWDTVPTRQVLINSQKGLRPGDPRPRPGSPQPALPISDAKKAVANGYISAGSISALLVHPVAPVGDEPSFHEDLFLSIPAGSGRSAASSLSHPSFQAPSPPPSAVRIRANIVDPSIAAAISDDRLNSAVEHVHLATMGSLAKLIPGLEVISEFNQDVPAKNPVPRFPVPPVSPSLLYVGYVIERHTLGSDGSMTLSRTIDVDDIDTSSFVDRQVLYGERYSYRIRAIVQWSRPMNVGFGGPSTLDRIPAFNPADMGKKQASFYAGDWSDWAPAQVLDTSPPDPPEEIYVRPISSKKQIEIVWKVPGDPQRDLSSLRLVRSVSRGGKVEDWKLIGEFVPTNGRFVDMDVEYSESGHASYVYAMYSVSYHGEVSALSDQFEARLTSKYVYSGEEPISRILPAGADPMSHAAGHQGPVPDVVIASRSVSLYCRGGRSTLPLFEQDYVVEVQSLSTGDRAEVQLALRSTDVGFVPNVPGQPAPIFGDRTPRQPGTKS